MKLYSIGEAAALLHWNRTTLERRIKRLNKTLKPPIKTQQGTLDAREYFISEADIQRIRDAYETLFKRRESVAHLPNDQGSLLAKIHRLQDQLAKAEAEYTIKTGGVVSRGDTGIAPTVLSDSQHLPSAESQIKRKSRQAPTATPAELPPGSRPVREFAEDHHVSRGTLESQLDRTWPKRGIIGLDIRIKDARRNRSQRWLAPDAQGAVITLWRDAGQPFDLCTVRNCPCSPDPVIE